MNPNGEGGNQDVMTIFFSLHPCGKRTRFRYEEQLPDFQETEGVKGRAEARMETEARPLEEVQDIAGITPGNDSMTLYHIAILFYRTFCLDRS